MRTQEPQTIPGPDARPDDLRRDVREASELTLLTREARAARATPEASYRSSTKAKYLRAATRSVAGPEIQLYFVVHAASASPPGSIARSIGSSTSATALGLR
jgi:hypothetical protein